jgi:hypothetical protein
MWFIAYSHHKGIIIWMELESCTLELAQQQQQEQWYMNCELSSVTVVLEHSALHESPNEDPLIQGGKLELWPTTGMKY